MESLTVIVCLFHFMLLIMPHDQGPVGAQNYNIYYFSLKILQNNFCVHLLCYE